MQQVTGPIDSAQASARTIAGDIIIKTVVTHTVTYFIMGALAFVVFDYPRLYAETNYKYLMRQTTDPLVMAGPLFQPVRGLIFGIAFFLLRRSFFGHEKGWLQMWAVLVCLGILGTFGPSPASVEGMIYTTLPLRLQFIGLPEVLLQALLLSFIVFQWVRRPGKIWLRWVMGSAFGVVLLLSALGLLVGQPQ
ncbi:MAG: hypothetical protein ABIQ52_10390 [Vicinamibacterales bacterium]